MLSQWAVCSYFDSFSKKTRCDSKVSASTLEYSSFRLRSFLLSVCTVSRLLGLGLPSLVHYCGEKFSINLPSTWF